MLVRGILWEGKRERRLWAYGDEMEGMTTVFVGGGVYGGGRARFWGGKKGRGGLRPRGPTLLRGRSWGRDVKSLVRSLCDWLR